MAKLLTLLLTILCLAQVAYSQEVDDAEDGGGYVVDSLLHEYAVASTDSARLKICVMIGHNSENVDTVEKYSRIGISHFDGSIWDDSILLYFFHFVAQVLLVVAQVQEYAECFVEIFAIRSVLIAIEYKPRAARHDFAVLVGDG